MRNLAPTTRTPGSGADVRAWSAAIALIVLLTPGFAQAHGEQYLINLFVGAALVPAWAVFAYASARRRLVPDDRRYLGALSVGAALLGVGWAWIGSAAVFDNFYYAPVLSPLGLSISAAPAAVYLFRRLHYGRAALLLAVPMLNSLACGISA
jgi:hypothetical protein